MEADGTLLPARHKLWAASSESVRGAPARSRWARLFALRAHRWAASSGGAADALLGRARGVTALAWDRVLVSGAMSRLVVFLDIDGVLAPIRRWDRYGDLHRGCIRVLNEIAAGAGADVVVSSTRRHGKTVTELQGMLEAPGFIGCVIDKTPVGPPGADRGEEIAAWLAEHAVGGYVIINDHGDMGELRSQLVLTHPAGGLEPADGPRAIEILRRPVLG